MSKVLKFMQFVTSMILPELILAEAMVMMPTQYH